MPKILNAMWLILQQKPDDFTTGNQTTVKIL